MNFTTGAPAAGGVRHVIPMSPTPGTWGTRGLYSAADFVLAGVDSASSDVSLLARMVTIWAKGMKKAEGVAGLTRNLSAIRLAASSLSIQMPEDSTPTRVTVSSLA